MTAPSRFHALIPALGDDRNSRAWVASALFLVALLVVTLPAAILDPRTLDGVSVWAKPIKFDISLALHFFTLALLATLLPEKIRTGITLTVTGTLAIGAMLFEQVYITIQAARGRRSHFNFETEAEGLLYALMGLGALLLILVAFALGLLIWKHGRGDRSAFRLGAILGLVLSAVLTLIFGGYMSSNFSHWVGETAGDATGLPLFGWSREAGDLRTAHFVTTHMIQTLPLAGFLLDRTSLNGRPVIWGLTALHVALAAGLFAWALTGRPLIPL